MDIFLKKYKDAMKTEMAKYRFKSCGKAFYRVINDVVQYFVLHRWVPYGRSCTIDFNIFPLCIGIDKKDLSSASYDIGKLSNRSKWLEYDLSKEESVIETIDTLLVETKENLVPFFERATDCKLSYEEICNLQRRIYTQVPGGIIMHNNAFVGFTIKMGAYDKALEHLKAIEKINLHMNVQTLQYLDQHGKEEYERRHYETLAKIRKEIELISIPDVDYINSIITKNEEYSLNNLCGYKQKKVE